MILFLSILFYELFSSVNVIEQVIQINIIQINIIIKMSKIRFYLRPPYTPTAAIIFWLTLSHFSTDFF